MASISFLAVPGSDAGVHARLASNFLGVSGKFKLWNANDPANKKEREPKGQSGATAEWNVPQSELTSVAQNAPQIFKLQLDMRNISYGTDDVKVYLKVTQSGNTLSAYDDNGNDLTPNDDGEFLLGTVSNGQNRSDGIGLDLS